jgi:hypothetical protein
MDSICAGYSYWDKFMKSGPRKYLDEQVLQRYSKVEGLQQRDGAQSENEDLEGTELESVSKKRQSVAEVEPCGSWAASNMKVDTYLRVWHTIRTTPGDIMISKFQMSSRHHHFSRYTSNDCLQIFVRPSLLGQPYNVRVRTSQICLHNTHHTSLLPCRRGNLGSYT